MPFALSLLAHDSRRARVHPRVEEYDDQDTSDEEDSSGTVTGSEVISSFTSSRTRHASSPRPSFMDTSSQQDYLMPAPVDAAGSSSRWSPRSSAASTPSHSRPSSPFLSPLYNSDADSEPGSPLLGGPFSSSSRSWWNDDRDNSRRWWDQPRRRYRHRSSLYRSARKTLHKFMLHPLVPTRLTTIVSSAIGPWSPKPLSFDLPYIASLLPLAVHFRRSPWAPPQIHSRSRQSPTALASLLRLPLNVYFTTLPRRGIQPHS